MRRHTRQLSLGGVGIGSDHRVSVQSMTTVPISDRPGLLKQITELAAAGCDIVRVAVDSVSDARVLAELYRETGVPLVADIQFCVQSAAAAVESGVPGIRINPGLFHDQGELERVAHLAADRGTVIRVGANSGSIGRTAVEELVGRGMSFEEAMATTLADKTIRQCELLESFGFRDIKVALKSSSVAVTVAACRRFAGLADYPLHLGVTEAGTPGAGVVKSAVGIGSLLLDGIGDTIRVSLTASPMEEVRAGLRILESCGLREAPVEIVSCPTCGRTEIDLVGLVQKAEDLVAGLVASGVKPAVRKIAVMGCPVNGPGEASNADLGMAGSRDGHVLIFRKGKTLGIYDEEEALRRFEKMLSGVSAD
ncbi:MAG: flavodoxin-dependent (E)-4-hydroxy-3-methylbut-2-enyl-diphosphate synthase [Victivallaceae bacterium]|nr:flavodoxin-dependent (E)-4-hydroxy-3-methylbut-2-enyl-diphosphate synthase [Victivallaceae bacterium]